MAGKKLTVKELKAVRARKREERLANMDRAMQLRAGGASLTEIAEQMHVALTTVASWVALRQAVERIDSERARKAS
jgi:orotate phosphoribosyltransferase-like protein